MKEMMYTLSHVPDVDVEESNAECGAQNSLSTIFNFSQFFKSFAKYFFFLTCYFGETHHLVYETRLERELVCLYIYHQWSVLPSFSLSAYTPQSTFPKFFFNGLILTT